MYVPVSMCKSVCIGVYVYIFTCICVCIIIYLFCYIYLYMYINMYVYIYIDIYIIYIGQTRLNSAPLNIDNNNDNNNVNKNNNNFYENNYNISGSNKLSLDIKKQINIKNKFEKYINNKYNDTMFKNKNQYKRNVSANIQLDSINTSDTQNERIILGSSGSYIRPDIPGTRKSGFKSGSQIYGRTRQLGMICI
jgi:hypothetical protein